MARFSALFLLFVTLSAFAAEGSVPILVQELRVEPGEGSRKSVLYEAFFPDTVRGYRILDAEGNSLRATTLNRQGSKVLIHFNAAPGETARLEALPETVRNTPAILRNGLLRSAKPYSGKKVDNLSDFRAEWLNGGTESIQVATQVFSGANPFGPNKNSLTMFTGFIDIAEPGVYAFCTASSDASFLLIDNILVAAAPGQHDVYSCLRGEHSGSIKLAKGTHPFSYCQANSRDDCFSIAAIYQSPKKMEVIPVQAFTPFLKVKATTISGEQPLSWHHTGTIEFDRAQLREVTLGDGRKIYFYDDIVRKINGCSIICPLDPAPMPMSQQAINAMLASACNAAKDTPPSEAGCRFLAVAVVANGLDALAEDFLKNTVAAGQLDDIHAMRLCQALLSDKFCASEQYERAAECWKLLSESRGRQFSVEYARVLLYFLGETDEAQKIMENIDLSALPPTARFHAQVLNADILLQKQGYAVAAAAYDQIAPLEVRDENEVDDGYGIPQGLPRDASTATMAFMNSQNQNRMTDAMQYLEQLERLKPASRLDPNIIALKYPLAAQLKRPRYAYNLARTLLQLPVSSSTAAAALLYMAKNRIGAQDIPKARIILQRLLEDYSDTASALQAERLMAEINNRKP